MPTMRLATSACAAGSMTLPLVKMACARVAQRFWECNLPFSGAYSCISTADFFRYGVFWMIVAVLSVLGAALLVLQTSV